LIGGGQVEQVGWQSGGGHWRGAVRRRIGACVPWLTAPAAPLGSVESYTLEALARWFRPVGAGRNRQLLCLKRLG
jgi:hypothetical protein